MLGGSSGLFTLFLLAAAGLIVFGWARSWLRGQEIDELRRSGTRVAATVTNILHERVQTSAGMPPNPVTGMAGTPATHRDDWYVKAEWTDPRTGTTRQFRSERLEEADARRYAAGEPITVLVDTSDAGRYYVEIAR